MVVGAFPIAKLAALLIKQVSKPIANALKGQAKSSPVFRKYVCMPPAQFYNWCEVQTKMWILNLGKPVNIPVLNEAMAIELGANLLGEGIIFIIAAGILVGEYYRSSVKEAKKEEAKRAEFELLQRTMHELYFTVEKQTTQLKELSRSMGDMETRVVQKPWAHKKDTPSKSSDDPPGPPPPPVPSSQPILTLEELETNTFEVPASKAQKMDATSNLLLSAINQLEDELFKSDPKPREIGIIGKALNHIYKDVYRLPLSM